MCHHLPVDPVDRELDPVLHRHPIAKAPLPVAGPLDAIDLVGFGKFDLHPSPVLARDPTPPIAELAIIDVFQFVDGVACQRSRSTRFASERHVLATRGENLKFVDARLRTIGSIDRKAHELGGGNGKGLHVPARSDRRPLGRGRSLRLGGQCAQLPKLCFAHHQGLAQRLSLLLRRAVRAHVDGPRAKPYSGKDGLHRIVVPLRHRIELVVVAARTADRQPKKGGPRRVDHVRQFVLPLHQGQVHIRALHDVIRPRHQESRSDVRPQRVARDVLFHELVIRLVLVERLDDVVAKSEGVGPLAICFESVALRKADDVQPMPRHPLAVVRILQHALHQHRPRLR